jgi:hypothetical protein
MTTHSLPILSFPCWEGGSGARLSRLTVLNYIREWVEHPALRRLIVLSGGSPPGTDVSTTLKWLERFSAQHWDFRLGRERHFALEERLHPDLEESVFDCAEELGLVRDVIPQWERYDEVLLLGGLLRACFLRPLYAAQLIKSGILVNAVTSLASFRELSGNELTEMVRLPGLLIESEFDAMTAGVSRAFSLDQHSLHTEGSKGNVTNSSWRIAEYEHEPLVRVIAAPSGEPHTRRANTADTYEWWARREDFVGARRLLIVTSAIYVPYQGSDAIRILGIYHDCDVDIVGVPPQFTDNGAFPQTFGPRQYLQEIRSAIVGLRRLWDILSAEPDIDPTTAT